MFSPSRQNRPQPQSTLARPLRRVPRPVARITARITARMTARIAAALGLVWLAGCDPVSLGGPVGATGPAINPNAPVSVALLVPRGSGNAGDDALADSLEKAARLAVAGLDGVQIDLRVYGTAAQPARAQEVALQAVAEGAKIILGPVYAENANAVAVAVAPKGVNVLSFSNNSTIAGGNLFVLGPTFDNTADRLVAFAARQGRSRIFVAHDQNVPGQLGAQAIERAVVRAGGTLAGTLGYELSQPGVIAAVPRIRAGVQAGRADALFLTANTAGALPILAQMLPEQGVSSPTTQFIGLTRWDIPIQALDLPGVQGGWFALPDPAATAAFSQRYQAAYGTLPHPIGGLAFDGIAAIGALVQQRGATALSTASLTQGAGFEGAGGVFRLRPDGTNERGLAVAQIRDRQVVVIDPAPRGFGGAGF